MKKIISFETLCSCHDILRIIWTNQDLVLVENGVPYSLSRRTKVVLNDSSTTRKAMKVIENKSSTTPFSSRDYFFHFYRFLAV